MVVLVRYICINNYCVFLMNYHLYHYTLSNFVSLPLWLEVYFFWYEFSYTCFFQLSFARSITLYTFNFSLFVFRTGECLGGSIYWVCCLLIHLATVCLLTDKLNPLTFSVIVDIWGFSIAILSRFLVVLYTDCFFLLLFLPF